MILPLELLCQIVLAYESFKALKAAPPPRKRRNANKGSDANNDGTVPKHSAYAANKRKRAMKIMLRAWLVYAISIPLEKIVDKSVGWLLPFYSSFRTLAVIAFLAYHKSAGDIGYSHFLLPFLKPREPSLDWLFAWLNEVLDVVCYIVIIIAEQIAQVFSLAFTPISKGIRYLQDALQAATSTTSSGKEEEAVISNDQDTTLLQVPQGNASSKTPRRANRKARYSEVATPYVPGHLVADESIYPPVQPRLHPAERSAEDLAAFQEAMDRAQAAFYEVESPPVLGSNDRASKNSVIVQEDDPFLPVVRSDRETRRNGRSNAETAQLYPREHIEEFAQLPADEEATPRSTSAKKDAVKRPSSKALGKRRQVEDVVDMHQWADQESPEKIAKIGSFVDSRDVNGKKTNGVRSNGVMAAKPRPAKARIQTGSKLPTRQTTRVKERPPEGIGISVEAQKAREAALLARKKRT